MNELTALEKWKDLAEIDFTQAATALGAMPREKAEEIAEEVGPEYVANIISNLTTDAATDMLRNLSSEFQEKILREIPVGKVENLREVLSYAPHTAGALMAKEYLAVYLDATIREATEYLQAIQLGNKGKVSYIYVIDKNKRLQGVIQIRDLIFYPPHKPIKEILKSPVVQVETGMAQLDVAKLLQKHRYLGLPVVDAQQRLVGVISADSALHVFEEEAADDIAKIIGTGAEEMKTQSIRKIIRLRMPWLFLSIISGLICAFISGVFQNSIQNIVALFLFVPIVLGLSESIGVQGATIIVRNLTLEDISPRDLRRIFSREILVGSLIGFTCGLIVGSAAWFWQGLHRLGLAISLSMTIAMFISGLIGLTLPILFKKNKIDPAIASGPITLAICDIQTLIVYFTVSGMVLNW